ATSPVSPFLILPGVWQKRSQIDSPLPSSLHAPSIWYEALAVPHWKPLGNVSVAMRGWLAHYALPRNGSTVPQSASSPISSQLAYDAHRQPAARQVGRPPCGIALA